MLYAYGVTVCVENSPTSNYTCDLASRVTSHVTHIAHTTAQVRSARHEQECGRGAGRGG